MSVTVDQRPESVTMVPLSRIKPDPGNPRHDVGDVKELAASIKANGVVVPLTLTHGEGDTYVVVAGHRRLAALLSIPEKERPIAGGKHVPALIRTYDERQRRVVSLVDNLQRTDLSALEEAKGYQELAEKHGLSQRAIAEQVGRSQSHVAKRLSLLELPAEVHKLIAIDAITIGQALELAPVAKQPEVIAQVLEEAEFEDEHRRYDPLQPGDLTRMVSQVKHEIERKEKQQTALEGLRAAKVSLVKVDQYGYPIGRHNLTELGKGWSELPMTPAGHKKEHPGGHAAWVDGEAKVHYVCTEPGYHKKAEDPAVAKAARRQVDKSAVEAQKKSQASRERNKVLRERAPKREAEIRRLVGASSHYDEALEFTLRQLIQFVLDHAGELSPLLSRIFDLPQPKRSGMASMQSNDWTGWLAGGDRRATPKARVQKLAYGIALAMGEYPLLMLPERSWFNAEYASQCRRYFDYLEEQGFEIVKTERAQLKGVRYGYHEDFDRPAKGSPKVIPAESALTDDDDNGAGEG